MTSMAYVEAEAGAVIAAPASPHTVRIADSASRLLHIVAVRPR